MAPQRRYLVAPNLLAFFGASLSRHGGIASLREIGSPHHSCTSPFPVIRWTLGNVREMGSCELSHFGCLLTLRFRSIRDKTRSTCMFKEKEHPPASGVSRRGFLKGVGAGTMASSLVSSILPETAEAAATPNVLSADPAPIKLKINGKTHDLKAEPRVTLLDALRNRLDITGAKKVCDRGTCGACTVLMDGMPVYACSILAVAAQGHEITTVEGLGTPDHLSPVQSAFIEHDASQCGFCTPGFVIACTAFAKEHPSATEEELQAALGGNLCRCGTYAGMRLAAMDAAKSMKGGA
jgi:xanthine dehydrogenase YagT iron-sulfur-binding subunit